MILVFKVFKGGFKDICAAVLKEAVAAVEVLHWC
jgi:hypothetical protein